MTAVEAQRVRWTQDEILLVCDMLHKAGWRNFSSTEPEIEGLSKLLRLHRGITDPLSRVRNPNSVKLKAWDLYSFHPDYTGAHHVGSRLDARILGDYLMDPESGAAMATEIRQQIA
jgi:hypothetical protein